MSHRRDETSEAHFRSNRCVQVNGAWFVTTREGIDVGPYGSKESAEAASAELAEMLSSVDDLEIARLFIREFRRRRARTL